MESSFTFLETLTNWNVNWNAKCTSAVSPSSAFNSFLNDKKGLHLDGNSCDILNTEMEDKLRNYEATTVSNGMTAKKINN